ncbi:uncharacterized protein EI90DRAFT_2999310, partial [Cantharellus anzutake]|uniref:uncharacterized protein n=1 Tax=Cantharellus anzutake TaxID=1750568 RepID=UPI001908DB08
MWRLAPKLIAPASTNRELCPSMGKHLDRSAKDILVSLSSRMTQQEIAEASGVSERTVRKLLTAPYAHHQDRVETRGRHRALKLVVYDLKFLDSLIEQKPDLYLDELQAGLRNELGIETSTWTISRALH